MSEEGKGVLYRAECDGFEVHYEEYEIVRRTAKGWTIKKLPTYCGGGSKTRWTNGKFASPTKEEARLRLERRRLAQWRFAVRDLQHVWDQLKAMGLLERIETKTVDVFEDPRKAAIEALLRRCTDD